jgi:phosphatidate cytidylyltransferase
VSNNTLRILTALVGVPLVVGLSYLGGWPFAGMVLAVSLVAQHELYGLLEAGGLRPLKAVGLALGALLALRVLVPTALPLAVAAVVLLLACSPFLRDEHAAPASLAATVFGALYPTALLAYLTDLRLARGPLVGDAEAFWLTMATLILIWVTDTFAYFVGRALGRHPLAPKISPKKTWEGAAGGVLGAVAAAVVLKLTALAFLAWPHVLAMAFFCGIVSQLGDLAESRMKRAVGIKDSGTILPGHGGLLDRFDAMILAAPCVYLYLAYVARLFE